MRNLLRTSLLLTLLVLLPAVAPAADRDWYGAANYGIRFGFGATKAYLDNLAVDGHDIELYETDTQVGYIASVFIRANMGSAFIQPEASFSHSRTAISFDRDSWDDDAATRHMAAISSDGYKIDVPLMFGYKVLNKGPYTTSIMTGPVYSLFWKDSYKTTFSGFATDGVTEDIRDWTLGWRVGLEYSIGMIIFNFDYQVGLQNLSNGISGDIIADRRLGTLEFAIGLMF